MLNNIVDNLDNVGSTTLFNAVFVRPEQVVRFLLCFLMQTGLNNVLLPTFFNVANNIVQCCCT